MEDNSSCKAEADKGSDPPFEMDASSSASIPQVPQKGMMSEIPTNLISRSTGSSQIDKACNKTYVFKRRTRSQTKRIPLVNASSPTFIDINTPP